MSSLLSKIYTEFKQCWITHGFWETTRFLIVTIYESLDKRFTTRLVCSRIETSQSETRLTKQDSLDHSRFLGNHSILNRHDL